MDFRPFPHDQITERPEAQMHRRFLKTHLPLDALVFALQAKYIYIARDGRDTLWSLYKHRAGFSDQAYELISNVPGRVGPPLERPTAHSPILDAVFQEAATPSFTRARMDVGVTCFPLRACKNTNGLRARI
jgi:hypothetical protein